MAAHTLESLVASNATPEDLHAFLDGLTPDVRLAQCRALSGHAQSRLNDRVEGRACTLDDFAPPGIAPLTEVIHEGRNSLAPGFRLFQKRFARSKADPHKCVGYNHQLFGLFTGPGYFEAIEEAHPNGVRTVVIDYTRLPTERCDGWPGIIPNSARLSRVIYFGTRDWMWKVSTHVTIGRARRGDGWMDNWFVLAR